ncbi:MAG: helix-turn-helix transcriptional regulator [Lachnospiraceae bacterium]|nr:helix-turn-helix transcriptional regulator [Lachnospiraceae bacterium]
MAERGITATEIAKQGGISQQAVSNALNGNRIGRVKVVPAIYKVLDLSAKDIVIIEE